MPLGKVGENLGRIVTDGGKPPALVPKLLPVFLQLDELHFAIRSPIRRPEEDNHGSLWSPNGVEILKLPILIHSIEIGNLLSDFGTRRKSTFLSFGSLFGVRYLALEEV